MDRSEPTTELRCIPGDFIRIEFPDGNYMQVRCVKCLTKPGEPDEYFPVLSIHVAPGTRYSIEEDEL